MMISQEAPSLGRAAARRDLLSEVRANPDAREVLEAHPGLRADRSLVLDLALEEYCVRTERGEAVDAHVFCDRFPSHRTSLRRLISAHRLLEADEGLPVSWPQPGETFARFLLRRELGHGGFAHVFLATELGLGERAVALKISASGAGEAEILGRLEHPNIVPVYSIHEDEVSGLTAVCMPYTGEATLCDVLDRAFVEPAPPDRARVILEAAQDNPADEALTTVRSAPAPVLVNGSYVDGVCHLGVQLAEALAFAHAQGVYHRDLKPSNVLLTPDGKPLLLDFNLAFDARRADPRLGGTIPYMAPEQLRATDPDHPGDRSAVDARSDVFSLGVILYELLTGLHPFERLSPDDAAQQLRERLLARQPAGPAPLRRANPKVDPALARVVEQCLAFDPKDRPQSAAELAAALRKSLSAWRRGRRWLARHVRAVLAAAVVVLAASVASGYAISTRTPSHILAWRDGVEAYGRRQYGPAAEHLSRAVAAVPENPWVWFARGRAYYQQAVRDGASQEEFAKLLPKAMANFEQADRLTADGRIMFCLGLCRNHLPNHPQAIDEYDRALVAGYHEAELFNNLGYCYSHLGKPEYLRQARRFLNEAVALRPNMNAAYHNRAWLPLRQLPGPKGLDPEAISLAVEDIRKALELGPVTGELLLDAGRILARATREDESFAAEALRFGRLAVQDGYDTETVVNALGTFSKKPQLFEGLTANLALSPTAGKPSKARRIADPPADLPAEALPPAK